ncbi:MAG: thioredoxin-disulfide reductase [Candidatus Thermoplasmatota archaeon]|jgi:thioredoxin reductase (NADPH)|nr:thioredoxin-disulfide reductase [Candidatus Thermoplasmatota archaeon]
MVEKIVIIGSGPAGLTAAIYAAREDFQPVVITGIDAGGQLTLSTSVENYPAFPEAISGSDLIGLMTRQAERFGTKFIHDTVEEINLNVFPYVVRTSGNQFETECIIIATGTSPKWLGMDGERRLMGKGVSSCATCDGPLFKGKDVVVVGGGDTAMEDSLFLANFASSVTIVHRRDRFRASKAMQNKVLLNPRIRVLWESEVVDLIGTDKLGAVKIRNHKSGEDTLLRADGLFVAIGRKPNSEFLRDVLPLDKLGYVQTTGDVMTGYKGVYVAGDLADHRYRQAVTAAGSGCKAALEAREYLLDLQFRKMQPGTP